MSDDGVSENVEKGSDQIIEGLSRIGAGIRYYSRSLSDWFDKHPLLKFVVMAPASAGITWAGIRVLNWVSVYFFGKTGIITRDLRVEVFPAPIGFTLWVFSALFVLIAIVTYFRFVTLRQRIDELEEQIKES